MDIALTLVYLIGDGCQYGGCTFDNTEDEYNALRWEDERKKPTWKELKAGWEIIKNIPPTKTKLELKIESLEARILKLEKI